MCIKLILVSAQAESTRAYLSILEKIPGIKVDTVASFGDLYLVLKDALFIHLKIWNISATCGL